MQRPELYRYSRNGYRPAENHKLTRSSNVDRIVRRNDRQTSIRPSALDSIGETST